MVDYDRVLPNLSLLLLTMDVGCSQQGGSSERSADKKRCEIKPWYSRNWVSLAKPPSFVLPRSLSLYQTDLSFQKMGLKAYDDVLESLDAVP